MSINAGNDAKLSADTIVGAGSMLSPIGTADKPGMPQAIFSAPTTPATHPHVNGSGSGKPSAALAKHDEHDDDEHEHEHSDDAHGHSHAGGHGHSHGDGDGDGDGDDDGHGHAHSHGGGHSHSHGSAAAAAADLTAALTAVKSKSAAASAGSANANADASASAGHAHAHGGGQHKRRNSDSRVTVKGAAARPKLNQHSAAIDVKSPAVLCRGVDKGGQQQMLAANAAARKKLTYAAFFCCAFMVAEVVGGIYANSLAVLTDAAHLLSDLAGFLISIFALWLASIEPTSTLSFGFHRAEILGALLSVLLIWVMTGILVYEAVFRVRNPEDVDGKLMFIVAGVGLCVNVIMGLILAQSGHGHSHGLGGGHGHSHGSPPKPKAPKSYGATDDRHGHSHGNGAPTDALIPVASDDHGHEHGGAHHREEENINVKAALVHVLGDALQSVGVMIAAGLIWYNPEWKIADPICTFFFSILVLFTTVRLVRQSAHVLMEGVPEGLNPDEVQSALNALPGVLEVHDLHIWSLSVGKPSLSCHLLAEKEAEGVLEAVHQLCAARFNIHHTTVQIETATDRVMCNPNYRLPPAVHDDGHGHSHDAMAGGHGHAH